MSTKLAPLALALAAAAITLTAVAAAGPVAAKQRIAIQGTRTAVGSEAGVLIPLTSGALGRDSGTLTGCCWSERSVVREGQSIDINDPLLTFNLKQGTLVTRSRVEWIDVGNGYVVGNHTWKVVRGTGDYAHLVGHGRGAVVGLPNGALKWRFEGFVSTRGS
jgi:hypothetical protein